MMASTPQTSPLPIDPVLPGIMDALRACPNLILRAPTGAGKTTRVPLDLMRADWTRDGWVVLVEPRRLAARAACTQMARQLGQKPGELVGYQVRHEKRIGGGTRVVAMTPGILLGLLGDDPGLEGISAIILDEFHERGLETDLILGLVRTVRETLRPDLRVVVMSATLDVQPLVDYLGDCQVIDSPGRLFPVTLLHQPCDRDTPVATAVARGVCQLLEETSGDLLAFLPGMGEIRATERALEGAAQLFGVDVLPLHGDLPLEDQDRALRGGNRRRVVLSTNVAESSVTVEGVTGVVDCTTARQLRHDPSVGLNRLEVRPVSQASLTQRAGRAGRVAPGVCLRLCSEGDARNRRPADEPEVRRVDLAGPLLRLACMGELDSFQ
ncbi:MAG: DEAD/DEAH box helicase, partial [Gemmataceae bacterium]